jgi:hypothetical protein
LLYWSGSSRLVLSSLPTLLLNLLAFPTRFYISFSFFAPDLVSAFVLAPFSFLFLTSAWRWIVLSNDSYRSFHTHLAEEKDTTEAASANPKIRSVLG